MPVVNSDEINHGSCRASVTEHGMGVIVSRQCRNAPVHFLEISPGKPIQLCETHWSTYGRTGGQIGIYEPNKLLSLDSESADFAKALAKRIIRERMSLYLYKVAADKNIDYWKLQTDVLKSVNDKITALDNEIDESVNDLDGAKGYATVNI